MKKHILKYLVLIVICGIVIFLPISYLSRAVNGGFESFINDITQKDFDVLDGITKEIEDGKDVEELENLDNYNFSEDENVLSLEKGLAKLIVRLDSKNNIVGISRLTTKGVFVFVFSSASFVIFTIAFVVCEILLVKKVDKFLCSQQITNEVKNTKE